MVTNVEINWVCSSFLNFNLLESRLYLCSYNLKDCTETNIRREKEKSKVKKKSRSVEVNSVKKCLNV